MLSNTIYNCPASSTQEGTHESVFCVRPSLRSPYAQVPNYYTFQNVIKAAGLMIKSAENFVDNNNFEYDLIDVVRQAVTEKARLIHAVVSKSFEADEIELFRGASSRFLELMLLQDRLLSTRKEFMIGTWLNMARDCGNTDVEKKWQEWNARVLITTWGNRQAAGLVDYANREWSGILRDLYYIRWKSYFEYLNLLLEGENPQPIDFYTLEEQWVQDVSDYLDTPQENSLKVTKEVYQELLK